MEFIPAPDDPISPKVGSVHPILPDIGQTPRLIGDLLAGISLPFRAIKLIHKTPELKRRVLFMSAIAFAVQIALIIGLIFAAPTLLNFIWPSPDAVSGFWGEFSSGLLRFFFSLAMYAVLLTIGILTLPSLLLVPFTDPLSAATESALGICPGGAAPLLDTIHRTIRETHRALVNMVARAVVFIFGHALLLTLNVIPVIGSPLWTATSWLWTALWTAMAYLDIPMARHLKTFSDAFRAFQRRKTLFLGFGAIITLLLWIPLLNVLLVPLAIVASTLLLLTLMSAGEV